MKSTKQKRLKDVNEKRKHQRLSIGLSLFCYRLTSRTYFFSSCENISLGGMCLSDNGFLKLDELMEFEIEFPSRTISCQGKIVWSKYLSGSEDKKTGVEFTNVKYKKQEFIADFILERNIHFVDRKI